MIKDFGPAARLDIDSYGLVSVNYKRAETPIEHEKRLQIEKKTKDTIEKQERQTLEMLLKKYKRPPAF
jgi:hypothetical protein